MASYLLPEKSPVTLPSDLNSWPVVKTLLLWLQDELSGDRITATETGWWIEVMRDTVRNDVSLVVSAESQATELKKEIYRRRAEPLPQTSAWYGLVNYLMSCDSETREDFLNRSLPGIIQLCLKVEDCDLFHQVSPQQAGGGVILSHSASSSILSSLFLCILWTETSSSADQHGLNFSTFFTHLHLPSQIAKLKCVLHYFECMIERLHEVQGIIQIEKKQVRASSLLTFEDLVTCQLSLCPVSLYQHGNLEDNCHSSMFTNFSSRNLDQAFCGPKCFQEDIRFSICPDLLLVKLFVSELQDNEAVLVHGVEQFSSYSGYDSTFTFDGHYVQVDQGRTKGSTSVLLDAQSFMGKKPRCQFEESSLLRDLNKLLIGFSNIKSSAETPYTPDIKNGGKEAMLVEVKDVAADVVTRAMVDAIVEANDPTVHQLDQSGEREQLTIQIPDCRLDDEDLQLVEQLHGNRQTSVDTTNPPSSGSMWNPYFVSKKRDRRAPRTRSTDFSASATKTPPFLDQSRSHHSTKTESKISPCLDRPIFNVKAANIPVSSTSSSSSNLHPVIQSSQTSPSAFRSTPFIKPVSPRDEFVSDILGNLKKSDRSYGSYLLSRSNKSLIRQRWGRSRKMGSEDTRDYDRARKPLSFPSKSRHESLDNSNSSMEEHLLLPDQTSSESSSIHFVSSQLSRNSRSSLTARASSPSPYSDPERTGSDNSNISLTVCLDSMSDYTNRTLSEETNNGADSSRKLSHMFTMPSVEVHDVGSEFDDESRNIHQDQFAIAEGPLSSPHSSISSLNVSPNSSFTLPSSSRDPTASSDVHVTADLFLPQADSGTASVQEPHRLRPRNGSRDIYSELREILTSSSSSSSGNAGSGSGSSWGSRSGSLSSHGTNGSCNDFLDFWTHFRRRSSQLSDLSRRSSSSKHSSEFSTDLEELAGNIQKHSHSVIEEEASVATLLSEFASQFVSVAISSGTATGALLRPSGAADQESMEVGASPPVVSEHELEKDSLSDTAAAARRVETAEIQKEILTGGLGYLRTGRRFSDGSVTTFDSKKHKIYPPLSFPAYSSHEAKLLKDQNLHTRKRKSFSTIGANVDSISYIYQKSVSDFHHRRESSETRIDSLNSRYYLSSTKDKIQGDIRKSINEEFGPGISSQFSPLLKDSSEKIVSNILEKSDLKSPSVKTVSFTGGEMSKSKTERALLSSDSGVVSITSPLSLQTDDEDKCKADTRTPDDRKGIVTKSEKQWHYVPSLHTAKKSKIPSTVKKTTNFPKASVQPKHAKRADINLPLAKKELVKGTDLVETTEVSKSEKSKIQEREGKTVLGPEEPVVSLQEKWMRPIDFMVLETKTVVYSGHEKPRTRSESSDTSEKIKHEIRSSNKLQSKIQKTSPTQIPSRKDSTTEISRKLSTGSSPNTSSSIPKLKKTQIPKQAAVSKNVTKKTKVETSKTKVETSKTKVETSKKKVQISKTKEQKPHSRYIFSDVAAPPKKLPEKPKYLKKKIQVRTKKKTSDEKESRFIDSRKFRRFVNSLTDRTISQAVLEGSEISTKFQDVNSDLVSDEVYNWFAGRIINEVFNHVTNELESLKGNKKSEISHLKQPVSSPDTPTSQDKPVESLKKSLLKSKTESWEYDSSRKQFGILSESSTKSMNRNVNNKSPNTLKTVSFEDTELTKREPSPKLSVKKKKLSPSYKLPLSPRFDSRATLSSPKKDERFESESRLSPHSPRFSSSNSSFPNSPASHSGTTSGVTSQNQSEKNADIESDIYLTAVLIVDQVFKSVSDSLRKQKPVDSSSTTLHHNIFSSSPTRTSSPKRARRSVSPSFGVVSRKPMSREMLTTAFLRVDATPSVKTYERRSSEPCNTSLQLSLQAFQNNIFNSKTSEVKQRKISRTDDDIGRRTTWRQASLDGFQFESRHISSGFKDPVLSQFAEELMRADTSVPELVIVGSRPSSSTTGSRRSSISGFQKTTLANLESELLNTSFNSINSMSMSPRSSQFMPDLARSRSRDSQASYWKSESSDPESWYPTHSPRPGESELEDLLFSQPSPKLLQDCATNLKDIEKKQTEEEEYQANSERNVDEFAEILSQNILSEAIFASRTSLENLDHKKQPETKEFMKITTESISSDRFGDKSFLSPDSVSIDIEKNVDKPSNQVPSKLLYGGARPKTKSVKSPSSTAASLSPSSTKGKRCKSLSSPDIASLSSKHDNRDRNVSGERRSRPDSERRQFVSKVPVAIPRSSTPRRVSTTTDCPRTSETFYQHSSEETRREIPTQKGYGMSKSPRSRVGKEKLRRQASVCDESLSVEKREEETDRQMEEFADRLGSTIVRDALHSFSFNKWLQFSSCDRTDISTGQWGCGQCCGDSQVKFVLQWLSASIACSPRLHYYTYGDHRLQHVAEMIDLVKGWTVSQLTSALRDYCYCVRIHLDLSCTSDLTDLHPMTPSTWCERLESLLPQSFSQFLEERYRDFTSS